jgi:hypothetical protein
MDEKPPIGKTAHKVLLTRAHSLTIVGREQIDIRTSLIDSMDRSGHNPFDEPQTWLQRQKARQAQTTAGAGTASLDTSSSGKNGTALSNTPDSAPNSSHGYGQVNTLPPPMPPRSKPPSRDPMSAVVARDVEADLATRHTDNTQTNKPTNETKHSFGTSFSFSFRDSAANGPREGSHVSMSLRESLANGSPDRDSQTREDSLIVTASPIHRDTSNTRESSVLPKTFVNYNVIEGNMIYHKITYSQGWVCLSLIFHIGQWSVLLSVGQVCLTLIS